MKVVNDKMGPRSGISWKSLSETTSGMFEGMRRRKKCLSRSEDTPTIFCFNSHFQGKRNIVDKPSEKGRNEIECDFGTVIKLETKI